MHRIFDVLRGSVGLSHGRCLLLFLSSEFSSSCPYCSCHAMLRTFDDEVKCEIKIWLACLAFSASNLLSPLIKAR
jgi:hypothetical protein